MITEVVANRNTVENGALGCSEKSRYSGFSKTLAYSVGVELITHTGRDHIAVNRMTLREPGLFLVALRAFFIYFFSLSRSHTENTTKLEQVGRGVGRASARGEYRRGERQTEGGEGRYEEPPGLRISGLQHPQPFFPFPCAKARGNHG